MGADIQTEPGSSATVESGAVSVPDGQFIKAIYPVTVEGEEPSEIIELFDLGMAEQLVAAMGGGADESLGGFMEPEASQRAPGGPGGAAQQGGMGFPAGGQGGGPSVQSVQFPSFGTGAAGGEQGNISLLMDVYMEMTVELGRTRKTIRDILGMGEGTIIELDKLAGEPVDILVNHKLIAKGEVVVIDENFGVRVTEIVDPMERVTEI
jgi:flagellar motor switch protein FliN/FliY